MKKSIKSQRGFSFRRFTAAISSILISILSFGQEKVEFAFLTDVHLSIGSPRIENLERCIEDINANKDIQFTVFGGDITEFGADDEIALAKGVIDHLSAPYYIVAGNHDAKWSESGCNTFAKVFGYEYFDFKKGGIRFIGCNSGPNMRMAPALLPHETLVWLDSLATSIPREEPVIFFNHYPQDTSMLNYFQVTNTLKKCNTQLLVGGHWHSNTILDYDGLPGILGRSPDKGKSIGYNIITIENGVLKVRERVIIDKNGEKCDILGEPWYTIAFHEKTDYELATATKENPYGLPENFPWLKFDVNDKYPQVKSVWEKQDESDIGCGITACGKYGAYANTQGVIKVIDIENGSTIWSYKTGGKVFSTPAIASNRVIVGSTDGYIYCLNLTDGKLLWKYRCGKSILASAVTLGDIAYIGTSDGIFRAINILTGKLVWKHEGVRGFVECKAYADTEQVVFGSWGNTLYSLDPANGKLQWKWSIKGSRMLSPAAVYPVKSNGKIFFVTPARKTYCLDAKNGEELWNAQGGRESIGLSLDGEKIFVKNMFNRYHAFSTSGEKAEELWKVTSGLGYDIAPTSPATAIRQNDDGTSTEMIFVATDKGNLWCLDAADGHTLWIHKVSVALINSVTPLDGNKLLLSTMDGVVTMLEY